MVILLIQLHSPVQIAPVENSQISEAKKNVEIVIYGRKHIGLSHRVVLYLLHMLYSSEICGLRFREFKKEMVVDPHIAVVVGRTAGNIHVKIRQCLIGILYTFFEVPFDERIIIGITHQKIACLFPVSQRFGYSQSSFYLLVDFRLPLSEQLPYVFYFLL
jgi:hypothetical protein